MNNVFYHVVTEKPMKLGQVICYDDCHHSGVYQRVYKLKSVVDDIYMNSDNYKNKKLDHHIMVALREFALEEVRKKEYPDYPSRLESLYVSKTLQEAEKWFDYFLKIGRPTFQIVKVKVNGNSFTGDACNCFDGTIDKDMNIELAKIYWKGMDNLNGDTPIYETIVSGKIVVIEIIKENKYI